MTAGTRKTRRIPVRERPGSETFVARTRWDHQRGVAVLDEEGQRAMKIALVHAIAAADLEKWWSHSPQALRITLRADAVAE